MEENTKLNAQEENGTDGAAGTPAQEEEKKFTQAELDNIIGERLSKQKKQFEEKYSGFDKWLEEQKTEAEKQLEKDKELDKAKHEIEVLKTEKKVLAAGVMSEFAEFVTDKLSKMDGDVDKNLEEYKKNNPQYFQDVGAFKKVSSAHALKTGGGATQTTNDKMNDFIRNARN